MEDNSPYIARYLKDKVTEPWETKMGWGTTPRYFYIKLTSGAVYKIQVEQVSSLLFLIHQKENPKTTFKEPTPAFGD